MLSYFAATDPMQALSSGNYLILLAFIIVTLAGVIIYLARKLDLQQRDSAAEIKSLNAQLLAENKTHANDYREMAKDNQDVLHLNSQNSAILVAKIEAVKGKR